MSRNTDYFDLNRNDLKGCGTYKCEIALLEPGKPHPLLKVTPQWFVSPTTVHIGEVTFTAGGKATVSVFVCPAGFTAASWHTMLTTANWDTMNGWMMDRCSVETAGTHATIPCSTKDAYLLGPDDTVYVVQHGRFNIKDVTIPLELPTYQMITSNVKSLSDHLPRAPPSQVSYEWSSIQAAKRWTADQEAILKWLPKAAGANIRRIMDMIYDEQSDESEDEEKDNLTDCDP